MEKSKSPDGFPNEVEFCKRKFAFYKSDGRYNQRQIYKLDHVLIIIEDDPAEPGPYFDVAVYTTSHDHQDRLIAKGSSIKISQAVNKAENYFQNIIHFAENLS